MTGRKRARAVPRNLGAKEGGQVPTLWECDTEPRDRECVWKRGSADDPEARTHQKDNHNVKQQELHDKLNWTQQWQGTGKNQVLQTACNEKTQQQQKCNKWHTHAYNQLHLIIELIQDEQHKFESTAGNKERTCLQTKTYRLHQVRVTILVNWFSSCTAVACLNGWGLESQVRLELLCNLPDHRLEWQSPDQQVCGLWKGRISLRATVPDLKRWRSSLHQWPAGTCVLLWYGWIFDTPE